ncbi:sugar kinase [bacterium]|nr:MAG: sugar kinase [bacterium]
MSIIVLGTVALDTVKTPFGKRTQMLGGSAVHFAMAARIFTKVNLVAVIGSDFPEKYITFLQKKGVVLSSLIKTTGETFKWTGEYRGDLNNAITLKTQLGVLADFKPIISQKQRKIKNVFLANIDPDIQRYFLGKIYSPSLVGLDSMNYWILNKRNSLIRLLKEVDIYVANEHEARDLSGESNLIKAASYLHSLGPRMVLIKKGEHGALFYDQKQIFCLPAYPTDKVIDPTGAGDTFAGGLMGYLARASKVSETIIKKAIAYGTVAASFNVEDFGVGRTSCLKRKDLLARLRRFRKYVLF